MRHKIKGKYLKLIKPCKENKLSNTIESIEKKIMKSLISFLLIISMLFWGIIPTILLALFNINPETLSNTTKYIITFINDLLYLILLTSIYYKTIKKDLYKYFNNNFKNNFKTSLSYWGVGLLIMYISNIIIAIVTNGQIAQNEEAVRSLINIAPLYMAFQVGIYAPLTEELIFRKSIRDIIDNKYIYALISGLIFGGLHAITSINNLISLLYLIPYCSLGIAFGLLYAKSNNIFSTIIIHSIHNLLAFTLYMVAL